MSLGFTSNFLHVVIEQFSFARFFIVHTNDHFHQMRDGVSIKKTTRYLLLCCVFHPCTAENSVLNVCTCTVLCTVPTHTTEAALRVA